MVNHSLLVPTVSAKISPKEYDVISHYANSCGDTVSNLIRKVLISEATFLHGFGGSKEVFLGNLLQGMLAGILILAFLNLFLLLFGVYQIKPNLDYFWSNLFLIIIKAILAGLVIGFIEESIFRGALFSSLYKKTGAVVTVTLTSLVYAAVHFLKYRALPEGTEITWVTGMEILPEAFFRFSDPNIIDHFLTLLVLGVLLSMVRIRNGNIAMCIGIHAGIVMTMKVTGRFSDYMPGSQFDFLVSRYDHMLGYLSLVWLLVLAIVYWRMFLARKFLTGQ